MIYSKPFISCLVSTAAEGYDRKLVVGVALSSPWLQTNVYKQSVSKLNNKWAKGPVQDRGLRITDLDDSLRWRAVGRLEAGQSQAKEARWLQVVSRLWNQFQTSGTVTRKVDTEHWHLHMITTWH
ncbi:hypothetical protein TNCV_1093261 [Trichonephila clavipes]|nr:hypothetical protein TNCV_1093261 [Trichonephila clavipes]